MCECVGAGMEVCGYVRACWSLCCFCQHYLFVGVRAVCCAALLISILQKLIKSPRDEASLRKGPTPVAIWDGEACRQHGGRHDRPEIHCRNAL